MPPPREDMESGEDPLAESAAVTFKKYGSGQLYLTSRKLLYYATGADLPSPLLVVPVDRIHRQLVSKPGATKVSLKVEVKDPTGLDHGRPNPSYTFTFVAPTTAAALEEREAFKTSIASLLASEEAKSGEYGEGEGLLPPKSVDPSSLEVRLALLTNNPALAELHQNLVGSQMLDEEEFWEGRRNDLETQAALTSQQCGPDTGWLELKPRTEEGKEVRYTLTPTVIEAIFRQDPGVRKAYKENVPVQVTEEVFWQRYLRSKYFHRNRLSGKASGADPDPIFDKALEDDEELVRQAPERAAQEKVNRFLDLTTTQEDHLESGSGPDFTMKPGTDESTVSLIRRFNRHSQSVVRAVMAGKRERMGEKLPKMNRKRSAASTQSENKDDEGERRVEEEREERSEIILDDLEKPKPSKRIALHLKDQFNSYFQASPSSNGTSKGRELGQDGVTNSAKSAFLERMQQSIENISQSNDKPPIDPDVAAEAFSGLDDMMVRESAGDAHHASGKDIPPPLLAMLTRLNAAATELLRHFWSTQSMSEASGRDKAERIIMKLQEIRVEVEGGVQGNEAAKETVASLRDAIARVLDHHGSSTQAS